ncbi:MAG: SRPBCC family protein [SAR202 cluster bacterium]|nr:SRPBCC family protein [SAR202 cluster bacterium]
MKVTEHIIIDRPIQLVFDYLAQPESAMKWQSSVIGSEKLTDGPPSVNMKAKVVQTLAGQEVTFIFRTTSYIPNSVLAFTTESGPAHIDGLVECKELKSSTRVTFTLVTHLSGFFRLVGPAVQNLMQNEMQNDTRRLKSILESPCNEYTPTSTT